MVTIPMLEQLKTSLLKHSKEREKVTVQVSTVQSPGSFRRSDVRTGLFLFMLHFVFKLIIHFLLINASAGVKATITSAKGTTATG